MRKLTAILALLAAPLAAQSLSTIRDTIHNPDGTLFTGRLVISWPAFQPAVGGAMTAGSTIIGVYSGYLSVVLVPTTNATPPASYTVDYETQAGTILRTEFWFVPPSWNILTIAQLDNALFAVARTPPTVPETPVAIPPPPTAITATLPLFADAEKPSGAIDGTNRVFTLTAPPSPAASLLLFRNGLLQSAGSDYTLSGATITFLPAAAAPLASDNLIAWYRH